MAQVLKDYQSHTCGGRLPRNTTRHQRTRWRGGKGASIVSNCRSDQHMPCHKADLSSHHMAMRRHRNTVSYDKKASIPTSWSYPTAITSLKASNPPPSIATWLKPYSAPAPAVHANQRAISTTPHIPVVAMTDSIDRHALRANGGSYGRACRMTSKRLTDTHTCCIACPAYVLQPQTLPCLTPLLPTHREPASRSLQCCNRHAHTV